MTFDLYPLRFHFRSIDEIRFPQGKAANSIRGGFGQAVQSLSPHVYRSVFAPHAAGVGPSGIKDSPRPFILRAAELDGRCIAAGDPFHFDLNVFETRQPELIWFVRAFSALAREGFGIGRGRAELVRVTSGGEIPIWDASNPEALLHVEPLRLPLDPLAETVRRIRVNFLTPTELKCGEVVVEAPVFPVLFSRVRDRISTLRQLYGEGPLDIPFQELGRVAAEISMVRCEIEHVDVRRRSSRTGQVHPLGGFVGLAEYEGELAPFLPYLKAAEWTGVGRQTVWGKGQISVERLD